MWGACIYKSIFTPTLTLIRLILYTSYMFACILTSIEMKLQSREDESRRNFIEIFYLRKYNLPSIYLLVRICATIHCFKSYFRFFRKLYLSSLWRKRRACKLCTAFAKTLYYFTKLLCQFVFNFHTFYSISYLEDFLEFFNFC